MTTPEDSRSDEALAALVQGNNQEAFGVLMDRYQAKLLRYGRRFLSHDEHIVDVVQDVFIKAYQNMQSFDATRKFSPWIYRIAHNAFVNEIRRKKRDPLVYLDLDAVFAHPSYEMDPGGDEERAQMQSLINKGLDALTPAYREVIILYYLEEQSYQEIADILQVPVGTVGVRLRRAREALKKYVERN
ncbi:MAG: sigma-70 family RNA polymerase sigma factor [Patescibacteria group bacterium]|nr:sigma-70 family RNA polymerase sigma factor [Patescibacteria group bacterium]